MRWLWKDPSPKYLVQDTKAILASFSGYGFPEDINDAFTTFYEKEIC